MLYPLKLINCGFDPVLVFHVIMAKGNEIYVESQSGQEKLQIQIRFNKKDNRSARQSRLLPSQMP